MPAPATAAPSPPGQDDQTDGDDNGIQTGGPKTVVKSPLITLTPGAEPLGNGSSGAEFARGGDVDDYVVDASGDMTVDFGFVEPGTMGIGNLVFVDDNGNNRFDVGEGRDGVAIELYRWGDTPGVSQPVASTITANGGLYLFSSLWQGQYFLYLPSYQFAAGGSLRGLFSLLSITPGDDNVGQDALPDNTPWTDGLRTGLINLVQNQEPTDADTETGFDYTSDDADDSNTDLTQDIGLFRPVAVGNMVFDDSNSNGHYDTGEGMAGVTVELYADTQYPEVDTPLATTISDSVAATASISCAPATTCCTSRPPSSSPVHPSTSTSAFSKASWGMMTWARTASTTVLRQTTASPASSSASTRAARPPMTVARPALSTPPTTRMTPRST